MEKKDLQSMDKKALFDEIVGIKKELFDLRLKLSVGEVKDYSQFKKLRQNAARALTILKQKSNK